MTSSLPRFDFSGMTLKDDSELDSVLKDSQGQREEKYFKPGKHEVQIVASEYLGTTESDDTWGKYSVTMEGTGGKLIKDTVMVPFRDITIYRKKDGSTSTFPAKKIRMFLEALGASVTIKTLGDTLKSYFGKDNALVGLNLAIEVAYQGNHVKYLGKDPAGEPTVGLVSRRGDRIEGTPVFKSYAEANEYAAANSIAVKRFPDVDRYLPSATPNKTMKADW